MATPETWLKLMAGKKVLEGGIEGANKAFEGFSLQARADKIRKKEAAKAEKVERDKRLAQEKSDNQALLREHGSIIQHLSDISTNFFRASEDAAETAAYQEEAKKNAEKQAKDSNKKDDTAKKEKPVESVSKAPEMAAAPIVQVSSEPSIVTVEQETPVPVSNSVMEELVSIQNSLLQIDTRRDAREVKAERRALEDRRDAKTKGAMALGAPTLTKKEDDEGGFLSGVGDFLTSMPMLIAGAGTAATAAAVAAYKAFRGGAGATQAAAAAANAAKLATIGDNVDDIAKTGAKVSSKMGLADDALKGVAKTSQLANAGSNLATKFDDLARAGTYADDFTNVVTSVGTKVDDATSGLARGTQVATKITDATTDLARAGTYADDFAKVGTQIATGTNAVTDTLKGGVQATNVGRLTTAIDGLTTASQGLAKSTSVSTVAGSVDNVGAAVGRVAGSVDNIAGSVDNIGVVLNKVDDGVKATQAAVRLNSAGRAINASGQFVRAADGLNAADDAARVASQAASNVPTSVPTTTTPVSNTARVVTESAEHIDEAARIAAQNADEMAKTLNVGAKTGGKLLSRISKVLAPLDIINKMGQGQGFFESIANMGAELGQLAVGGTDWIAEKVTGGEGFISEGSWGDSSRMLDVGDVMGNQEKWQTSYLEQGINKAVAGLTGTEQVANAKEYTEAQEALAEAAEDLGAVDIGFGKGSIDDLEKLATLNAESLKALLDVEVWSDKDQALIEAVMKAKMEGQKVEYDDRGFWKSDVLKFGQDGQTPEEFLQGAPSANRTMTRDEAIEQISRAMQQPGLDADKYAELEETLMQVKGMTPEEFNALTPDAATQDAMATAATTPGSIFTNDTHLLDYLKTLNKANPFQLIGKTGVMDDYHQVDSDLGVDYGHPRYAEGSDFPNWASHHGDPAYGEAKGAAMKNLPLMGDSIFDQGTIGDKLTFGLQNIMGNFFNGAYQMGQEGQSALLEGTFSDFQWVGKGLADLKEEMTGYGYARATGADVSTADLAWKVGMDADRSFDQTSPNYVEGNPAVDSRMLEQAVVTSTMLAEKQRGSGGGGNAVISNQVDNSIRNNTQINNPSTAHSPFRPAGIGHMGITTPRG